MKARIVDKPKVFEKIELIIEKKEEAEMLWMLLGLSYNRTIKALEEYPDAPNVPKAFQATVDMFTALDKEFTPEWYNDC